MTRYLLPHIAKLAGYTPGEQINAPGVIKLNTNENPYPPSPRALATLRELDPDALRRYPQPLADDFRAAAAEVFRVDPDMILAGNGSDDLLTMIVRAFLPPGGSAVAPYPNYTLYEVLARIQDATLRWIDWPGDYSLPADALASADAKLCFIANPNAQTGTFVQPEAIQALADRFDGLVVVDEAYGDFAGEGSSCIPAVREHENMIVLRTLSKGYGLAGLRFGFGVAPTDVVAALAKVKDSYNCDAASIAVAAAAIRDRDYLAETVAKVVAERERLTTELRDRGWRVPTSRANFILATPPDRAARPRYEALKRNNILVRYLTERGLACSLRITVGTPGQNDALLSALDDFDGAS